MTGNALSPQPTGKISARTNLELSDLERRKFEPEAISSTFKDPDYEESDVLLDRKRDTTDATADTEESDVLLD